MKNTKEMRARLRAENRNYPPTLQPVNRLLWPRGNDRDDTRVAVFRSRCFLVQVFLIADTSEHRISVNRTDCDKQGNWIDGITWDELMQIKRECGFGDYLAVEFYPADCEVVNVANMRHLFIVHNGKLPQWWTK